MDDWICGEGAFPSEGSFGMVGARGIEDGSLDSWIDGFLGSDMDGAGGRGFVESEIDAFIDGWRDGMV